MLGPDDTVLDFQARRRETWRIVRPWVVVTVTAFLAMAALFTSNSLFDELWKLIILYGGFLVLLVSIGRISLTVSKLYRCPACGSVPRSRGSVLLDPGDCPKLRCPIAVRAPTRISGTHYFYR